MSLISLIFPRKCFDCGKYGKYFCDSCVENAALCRNICPYCERPSIDGATHACCIRTFGLNGEISLFEYSGLMRKGILSLKYRFAFDVARELSALCVTQLKSIGLRLNAVLVPVPLHWYRQNWRGFNQAVEVGKLIAREMDWRIQTELLIRKKVTVPQAGLGAKLRVRNTRGVFAVNPSSSSHDLSSYPAILLFDDVWTTGSTMKEAARVLKRAGARKVYGLTIAR